MYVLYVLPCYISSNERPTMKNPMYKSYSKQAVSHEATYLLPRRQNACKYRTQKKKNTNDRQDSVAKTTDGRTQRLIMPLSLLLPENRRGGKKRKEILQQAASSKM